MVLLLTDEMCQVSAKLDNTQEQGIVMGQRGTLKTQPNLRFRFLSKEADAKPGHRVVSSGAGELFPPDMLLGEVVNFKVGVIDGEATLKPIINFDNIKDVFVIVPDKAAEEEKPPVTTTDKPALPRKDPVAIPKPKGQ